MDIDERYDEITTIAARYHAWAAQPFPPQLAGATIEGEEVVLLDADVAALVRSWLARGCLSSAATTALTQQVALLRRLSSSTTGASGAYWCELAEIAEGILTLCEQRG